MEPSVLQAIFLLYWVKDGAYSPRRGGKMVLRHVHLPPSDPTARAQWAKMHRRRRRRRTSNPCLLYAHDRTHGYLLLYVARSPMVAASRTCPSLRRRA